MLARSKRSNPSCSPAAPSNVVSIEAMTSTSSMQSRRRRADVDVVEAEAEPAILLVAERVFDVEAARVQRNDRLGIILMRLVARHRESFIPTRFTKAAAGSMRFPFVNFTSSSRLAAHWRVPDHEVEAQFLLKSLE